MAAATGVGIMPPSIDAANLGSVPVALAPHRNHFATAGSADRQRSAAAERASFQGLAAVDGFDGGGGGGGNGIASPYAAAHSGSTRLHQPQRGWVFCT